ncbi:MAG: cupin domain-containing protein [Candidatus Promineofilum sp.]|nr:cupin domain-containing protein [Promineifilum sp.]
MKIVQIDSDSWQAGRGYRKSRLLSAETLGQSGTLLQIVAIPAGAHVPPHSHRTSVEVYIVRRGVCELTVDGLSHELRPGDVVLMEPGDVHELFNPGEEVFEVWVFKTNAFDGDAVWD